MENNQYNHVSQTKDHGLASFFSKIYAYLGVGIAVSAVSSYLALNVFQVQVANLVNTRFGIIFLWVAQIGLALFLSAKAVKNPTLAFVSFIGYSLLMGITLGITLSMYNQAAIYKAFLSASITYGAMAIVGTRTKRDLSGMGQALRGALIGIIISILLNAFLLKSGPVDFFISIITVIVFAGLTAYDHQKIKVYYEQAKGTDSLNGLAVFCALQLYLDFINLLLAFLRIFGRD